MKIVTVANAAGSAGKTTTVVTLAALLAAAGKRVLVVDLDGQANSTRWLGLDPDDVTIDSGDVLLRRHTLEEAIVATNTDGVTLLPATEAVYTATLELQNVTGREMRLQTALRKAPDVDVVLVDCPGTIGLMTVAALVATDAVVTVTQPTSKELEGIQSLEDTLAEVAEDFDKDVRLDAIVPCIVPPASAGTLYVEALSQLQEVHEQLVTPPVRRSVKAAGAYSHRTPLPSFAPRADVTADYEAVMVHLTKAGVLA